MRRINDNEVALTNEEIETYRSFIRDTLARDWDSYTSQYICTKDSHESGMRRMNETMYDLAAEMLIV